MNVAQRHQRASEEIDNRLNKLQIRLASKHKGNRFAYEQDWCHERNEVIRQVYKKYGIKT